MLKLKEGKFLDFEKDGAEFVLEVTAKDQGEEDGRESVKAEITIKLKDEGDAPTAANKIGNWWVTVNEDLNAEDVLAGDWLSFRLDTTPGAEVFKDADKNVDLTYSVQVAGGAVDWLQIHEDTGKMTNKAGMLPERGVYMVTVTAEDGDDKTPSASVQFKLAVALSDEPGATGKADENDQPHIADDERFEYTENSGAKKVASFTVDDDDIAIAPHPYGVLLVDFEARQQGEGAPAGGTDVKDRLVLRKVREDTDAVHYEIWTKSDAQLKMDDKGDPLPEAEVPGALDADMGDEVQITVMVWDNFRYQEVEGELQSKPYVLNSSGVLVPVSAANARSDGDLETITFRIADAPDSAPEFTNYKAIRIDGDPAGSDATRAPDPKSEDGTTTIKVGQQGETVIVVPLEAAWKDGDTDSDDLRFGPIDREGLPDWITVYGPARWESIQSRSRRDPDTVEVQGSDGPGLDGLDRAVAIVIDRRAETDDDELPDGELPSFTLTARDPEGNEATETIRIEVVDTDALIADADEDKVVTIDPKGDPNGTGSLEMKVDLSLDPDLDGPGDALLAVYTWSHDDGTDSGDPVIISVSSTPQPLDLDANDDNVNDYSAALVTGIRGAKIKASVQYYEVDPETGAIAESAVYESKETDAVDPATPGTAPAGNVKLDVTTSATGLVVAVIGNTGQAAGGTTRWQKSEDGGATFTTLGPVGLTFSVDANGDTTPGDGGGNYYRAVYTYQDANDNDVPVYSEAIELGTVSGSGADGTGDPTPSNVLLGSAGTVDRPVRVDTGDTPAPAKVQWQRGRDVDSSGTIELDEWEDIDGQTGLSLIITREDVGHSLRAKVTYTQRDNPATTGADESSWVRWIEYTDPATGPVAAANVGPQQAQASGELRVVAKKATAEDPIARNTFDASDLFLDRDGDGLTYTITTVAPAVDGTELNVDATTTTKGTSATLGAGGQVFRVVTEEWNAGATPPASEPADPEDVQQAFWIDSDTGMVTYFTDEEQGHDGAGGVTNDGAGNMLTFTIQAAGEEGTSPVTATVVVRINVAPTAINFNDGDSPAANLSTKKDMPTAITVADGPDAGSDPDEFGVAENVKNQSEVELGAINVRDENDSIGADADNFGTHRVEVEPKYKDHFEIRPDTGGDSDGSTWSLWLKQGATFDYETQGTAISGVQNQKLLTVKVTATDGGGLKTEGYFSIRITNDTSDDTTTTTTTTTTTKTEDPEGTDGLRDADGDEFNSEDGPAIPPKDGGAFIDEDDLIGLAIDDDLLGDFVLAIDDGIDIA
ncbi:MAG: hypothetical protein OXE51_03700 [Gammaproteobacteria bacterium]|nr:hypothetical protein [Gammaproteobacteria bacterium]